MKIKTYDFNEACLTEMEHDKYGENWPAVYLLNNRKYIYVGETSNVASRTSQHLNDRQKQKYQLEKIFVICDDEYNKSAVLDIEQSLIQLFNADNKFELINQNAGQSSKHNYYQREKYINKLEEIWNRLIKMSLVDNSFDVVKNTDLFKYSPYNSLTNEQAIITYKVIDQMVDCLEKGEKKSFVIHGCAGTGKTVLAINMIYRLITADRYVDMAVDDEDFTDEQKTYHKLKAYIKKHGKLSIGFVVPMASLRATIETVFRKTKNGLSASLVLGPSDVAKQSFDILFVDESHRLSIRKNITNMQNFDLVSKKLGFDPKECSQLDWIRKQSQCQILFYDQNQTVKGSDIPAEKFNETLCQNRVDYRLKVQMRCQGGESYIHYIDQIFQCMQKEKIRINHYDFRVYDDIQEMVSEIEKRNHEVGLSRVVAGYSWKWISKGKTREEILNEHLEDISIDHHRYYWNMTNTQWIMRNAPIEEFGCIHTTQGYDLNYVGVVFGNEISYNKEKNCIEIDLNQFYDANVKRGSSCDVVKQYILNAYKVMLERGIKGCYVYACDTALREYLKQFLG